MWSVPDWRTDEMYSILDNREQGIYRNLIDECWVSGSISADMEVLARTVREPLDYFLLVWNKIGYKFRRLSNGQLTSKRLLQDRRRLDTVRHSRHNSAQKAAKARWSKASGTNGLHAPRNASGMREDAQTQTQTQRIQKKESSPLEDPSNTVTVPPLETGASADKPPSARPRDMASDYFAAKCREMTDVPYVPEGVDFVNLAKLRKAYNTPARQLPPGWEQACENYFASPLGQYSLADLANLKRYAVFRNSPLDQYKTPTNHVNRRKPSEHKTKTDRTVEESARLRAHLDRQAGERDERGDQRGHTGNLLPPSEDRED